MHRWLQAQFCLVIIFRGFGWEGTDSFIMCRVAAELSGPKSGALPALVGSTELSSALLLQTSQ